MSLEPETSLQPHLPHAPSISADIHENHLNYSFLIICNQSSDHIVHEGDAHHQQGADAQLHVGGVVSSLCERLTAPGSGIYDARGHRSDNGRSHSR